MDEEAEPRFELDAIIPGRGTTEGLVGGIIPGRGTTEGLGGEIIPGRGITEGLGARTVEGIIPEVDGGFGWGTVGDRGATPPVRTEDRGIDIPGRETGTVVVGDRGVGIVKVGGERGIIPGTPSWDPDGRRLEAPTVGTGGLG